MSKSDWRYGLRVFVDTSAYYALVDRGDKAWARADYVRGLLARHSARLFTTSLVLAETHALVLSRFGAAVALRVLESIDRSSTTVVRPTTSDEDRARSILHDYTDKDFSLTDATSFAVMERMGLDAAFTFDHHFTQYGVHVVAQGVGSGE